MFGTLDIDKKHLPEIICLQPIDYKVNFKLGWAEYILKANLKRKMLQMTLRTASGLISLSSFDQKQQIQIYQQLSLNVDVVSCSYRFFNLFPKEKTTFLNTHERVTCHLYWNTNVKLSNVQFLRLFFKFTLWDRNSFENWIFVELEISIFAQISFCLLFDFSIVKITFWKSN